MFCPNPVLGRLHVLMLWSFRTSPSQRSFFVSGIKHLLDLYLHRTLTLPWSDYFMELKQHTAFCLAEPSHPMSFLSFRFLDFVSLQVSGEKRKKQHQRNYICHFPLIFFLFVFCSVRGYNIIVWGLCSS